MRSQFLCCTESQLYMIKTNSTLSQNTSVTFTFSCQNRAAVPGSPPGFNSPRLLSLFPCSFFPSRPSSHHRLLWWIPSRGSGTLISCVSSLFRASLNSNLASALCLEKSVCLFLILPLDLITCLGFFLKIFFQTPEFFVQLPAGPLITAR